VSAPLPTEAELARLANMVSNKALDELSPDMRHQALLRLLEGALRLRWALDELQGHRPEAQS
jgi:hypothetical protein